LRARVDQAVNNIDRYAVTVLKVLLPGDTTQKNYKVSGRRVREEVDTEPNIIPFMNLMVVLIPLLLSSSEFVKLGMIELKLPEAAGGPGSGNGDDQKKNAKLNLGIAITSKGFNLFHYFKTEEEAKKPASAAAPAPDAVQIPLKRGEFDYGELQKQVAEVKRRALLEILRTADPSIPANTDLYRLQAVFQKSSYGELAVFADHEELKIVAQDSIKYQVVVSVMDAARGMKGPQGTVTMFPIVSIAGGIAY
jgi:biopolymer transport protein ExbD